MFLFSCAFSLSLQVFFLSVCWPTGVWLSMIPRKSLEPRKTESPQGARNVVVLYHFFLKLTQRYQKEICLTFVLYRLWLTVVFIFLFGTVFIQFQYFLYKYRYLNQKTVILPTQLKLQFRYQNLFNIKIYVVYSFITCISSLLVRKGSNKESTYTSDILSKFYMIF